MATMKVTTPGDPDLEGDAEIEEIPLPPELGESVPAAVSPVVEPTAQAADIPVRPVAKLEFLTPERVHKVIELQYPFTYDGEVYTQVAVRRLTGGEISTFVDVLADPATDNTDYAAFMTGVPSDVIRGMVSVDTLAVIEAALDFLPPSFQKAVGYVSSSPISGTGGASS